MSLKAGASVIALVAVVGFSPQAFAQTSTGTARGKTEYRGQERGSQGAGHWPDPDAGGEYDPGPGPLGQTVYDPDNAKIGSISDLILSKDGKSAEGFVIGVGGFLGIGEKAVALKLDRLKMTPEQDGSLKLAMDIKKEELSNAPTFKSRKEQEQEKQAERARSQPPVQPGQPKTN